MYCSVKGESVSERVIEKSRFLTYTAHVEGEEEARAFLARVREAHPLATHVCWAYIADKIGNAQRFSDDGEPQGTAGMPILGVIKAQKLFETAIAVVRYFGGIKLGAGGLTRAYAGCAAQGVGAAEVCEYDVCCEVEVRTDYSRVTALLRFLEGRTLLSREFSEDARLVVAVREGELEDFFSAVNELLCGKVTLTLGNKYFYPFAKDKR